MNAPRGPPRRPVPQGIYSERQSLPRRRERAPRTKSRLGRRRAAATPGNKRGTNPDFPPGSSTTPVVQHDGGRRRLAWPPPHRRKEATSLAAPSAVGAACSTSARHFCVALCSLLWMEEGSPDKIRQRVRQEGGGAAGRRGGGAAGRRGGGAARHARAVRVCGRGSRAWGRLSVFLLASRNSRRGGRRREVLVRHRTTARPCLSLPAGAVPAG